MELDLVCMFLLLTFLLGVLVGRCYFPRHIHHLHIQDNDPADWWKRGEEPPEYP